MRNRHLNNKHRGFTLLELLAVLTILALVIAVMTPAIFGQIKKARTRAARVQIETLGNSLNSFNLECGFFPTTEQGLDALLKAPTSEPRCKKYEDKFWDKKSLPDDPWNHPYVYVSPGKNNTSSYDLSSMGPDGVDGNEDDITNWGD